LLWLKPEQTYDDVAKVLLPAP